MTALGFLVFGIIKHRPGPSNVVFGLATRLPPMAGGFAAYPFALLSVAVIRRERGNPNLDRWLRESWLEEYYHAAHQQRPAGPFFYLAYAIEWLLDSARKRQPYLDSSLEADAKRWVQQVMHDLEPNPIPDFEDLVRWSKEEAWK